MIVLTPWLEHLTEHLPMAREGDDPEGVHQVRVAVRRLRVWLELAHIRVLEDDLAWLVRGAGKVRDLEVLLQDAALPKPFQSWAKARLAQARSDFIPMLDSPRLSGLLQALATLPALEESQAKQQLERFYRRVEQRAKEWKRADTPETLHALRRALRKLRYGLEWLDQDPKAIKELQEVLGRVRDLSFSLSYLNTFEAEGGKAGVRYRGKLQTALREALGSAHQAWKPHQKEL